MRLLLLPLAGLLLCGEALKTYHPAVLYVMPSYHERVRAVQQTMINRQLAAQVLHPLGFRRQPPSLPSQDPSRFVMSRSPSMAPSQSHSQSGSSIGNSHTSFTQPERPASSVLIRRLTEDSEEDSPPNFGLHLTPSTINQNHKSSSLGQQSPSSFNQDTRPSIIRGQQTPSSFNQDTRPSSTDQHNKPSSSFEASKAPSSSPNHQQSDSSLSNQGFRSSVSPQGGIPSIVNGHDKPSSFSHDHKPSRFDQDTKPLVDTHASHPPRSPACNIRPDPGPCRAAVPRYFFDPETGTCNCFLYGGCREDGQMEGPGSFFTLDECHRECRPPRKEEGPVCKDIFKKEQFISFLAEPIKAPLHKKNEHLSDEEYFVSLLK